MLGDKPGEFVDYCFWLLDIGVAMEIRVQEQWLLLCLPHTGVDN